MSLVAYGSDSSDSEHDGADDAGGLVAYQVAQDEDDVEHGTTGHGDQETTVGRAVIEKPASVKLEEELAALEANPKRFRRDSAAPTPVSTVDEGAAAIVPQPRELDRSLLPAPATGPCPERVKAQLAKLAEHKKRGTDLNARIESFKMYRNPSIYEKLIDIMRLNETGSNFPREKYDIAQWGEEDFADKLAEKQKEYERKRFKANAARTEIPFVHTSSQDSGGSQGRKRKAGWDQAAAGSSHKSVPGQPLTVQQQTRLAEQQREAMAEVRRRVEKLAAARKAKPTG